MQSSRNRFWSLSPRRGSLLAVLAAGLLLGAVSPAQASGFLWRVQHQGNTLYLAGSIHLAKQGMYPLPQAFEQAFASSDTLVVEADVMARPREQARLLYELAAMPKGQTLSMVLSDETKQAFEDAGLDWERYNAVRPWYALMSMQVQQLIRLGFQPEWGIDLHFLQRAHEQGMRVLELEGAETQFRLLASLEEMDQEGFLRFSILQMKTMDELAEKLVSLWTSGDVRGMEKALFGSLLFNAVFRPINERLFFERNERMAEKIMGYLKEGVPAFVIVGAGHMVGNEGLLQRLQEQGCSLTQL